MLDEKEKMFVEYWEVNRLKEKKISYQLLTGLPIGLLCALPIILILFSSRYWFKRADMLANSQLNPFVLVTAIFLIAVFVAVMYKQHTWDRKEQQFNELKAKQNTKS
jgi:hypothetical protein